MTRTRATVALLAVVAVGWRPALAQETAEPAPPPASATSPQAAPEGAVTPPQAAAPPPEGAGSSPNAAVFQIEKIVVEGVRRGSAKIVAAETLLRVGRSYTEPQLKEALQRVERLPFVVQADFSLRKGSERGRFELVITATEAKPVFFGAGVDSYWQSGCCGREGWNAYAHGPGLGARVFFAGQSELSAGLSGFGYSSFEGTFAIFNLAYTHHNLFGRHIAGTVLLGSLGNGHEVGAQLAIPLNRANVLTVSADRVDHHRRPWLIESAYSPSTETRVKSRRVGLLWQRDTTDDPFTPRQGSRIETGIAYADSDYEATSSSGLGPLDPLSNVATAATGQERGLSGSLQVGRYWPLSRRLSFGLEAGLRGSFADVEGAVTRDDVTRALRPKDWGANGSLKAVLLGRFPDRRPGLTQFWWTLSATASDHARWRDCDPSGSCGDLPRFGERVNWDGGTYADRAGFEAYGGHDIRATHATVSASIAARGRWGTFALGFHYRHYSNDRSGWR